MPFLMARAPVRRGRTCSLRSKAAVCEAPRTGSEGEALKRLGLGIGLRMERIVRVCVIGSDGQRKRGGRAKSRGVGWRGGIVFAVCVGCRRASERRACVPSINQSMKSLSGCSAGQGARVR
jgi:hypothetical protein